jgi:hypothetical protein
VATPLVVYLTLPAELTTSGDEPVGREKEIAELCRANVIPFLSLRRRFHPLRDRVRPRPQVRHWDGFEHRAAAQAIAEYVRSTGILRADPSPAPEGGA